MNKKIILPIALLTLSNFAFAGDEMSSLSYRVKANEFHYDLGFDFGKPKYSESKVDASLTGTNAVNNTEHKTYEGSQTIWSNEFSYGVSDALSIGVGLNIDLKNSNTQKSAITGSTADAATTWSSAERKNAGLESIDLNSSYRLMNGSTNADLLVGLNISGKGEQAAQKYNASGDVVGVSKGNAKKGGSEISLGTKFSGQMSAMEWAAIVGLKFNLKKKFTVVDGDLTSTGKQANYESETKSNMDLMLGVAGQYNINSNVAIGADLIAMMMPKEETSASAYASNASKTNITTSNKSFVDLNLGINMKYALTSNLLVGANYSHLFAADVEGTMKEVNGATVTNYNEKITNRKADMFGLSISYKF